MKKMELEEAFVRGRFLGRQSLIVRAALPLLLGFSLLSAAAADELFTQSPQDGNDAFPSISTLQSADGFVLAASISVTSLTWWGSYSFDPASLAADDFSVHISADDGSGRPKASPSVTITPAPAGVVRTSLFDVSGAEVYRYDLALATPILLAGATNWYLSVVNRFDVKDQDAVWYWLLSDVVGDSFYRAADVDSWTPETTGNLSFSISGDAGTPIPLPGTLLLLVCGLAGMAVMRSPACACGDRQPDRRG